MSMGIPSLRIGVGFGFGMGIPLPDDIPYVAGMCPVKVLEFIKRGYQFVVETGLWKRVRDGAAAAAALITGRQSNNTTSPAATDTATTKVASNFDGNAVPPSRLRGVNTVVSNRGTRIDITPSANHSTTAASPIRGAANSSVDLVDHAGNVRIRRWFGPNGEHVRDVHFTHHGNPGRHPEWPHVGELYTSR